jgi:hypothetical protein
MEAVAWMAGAKHSDSPKCTCPVLGSFGIALNDRMNDQEREKLNPIILKMINTRSPEHQDLRKSYILNELTCRIFAPVLEEIGSKSGAVLVHNLPSIIEHGKIIVPLKKIKDRAREKHRASSRIAVDAYSAYTFTFVYSSTAAEKRSLKAAYTKAKAVRDRAAIIDAAVTAVVNFIHGSGGFDDIVKSLEDAAEICTSVEDAQKRRSLWLNTCVAILSEAIEIGPHNADEFYQMERVEKYRELVNA